MLVLTRKIGEEIVIGDNVKLVVSRISGNRVVIGINAPADVTILRGELAGRDGQSQDPKPVPTAPAA